MDWGRYAGRARGARMAAAGGRREGACASGLIGGELSSGSAVVAYAW